MHFWRSAAFPSALWMRTSATTAWADVLAQADDAGVFLRAVHAAAACLRSAAARRAHGSWVTFLLLL